MNRDRGQSETPATALRRGWTTGACATAATKAALSRLLGGTFPDPVQITLPGGQMPSFALAREHAGPDFAETGIVKDAGDDPDVTHGATIMARVQRGTPGGGVRFFAGEGVGKVTLPGLPVAVGEPAINPVPRQMMRDVVDQLCAAHKQAPDIDITISVPGGAEIAKRTWNPRLGIVGGLSILGTTGIVIPYSCSAWIHSIHRGIDVARAIGLAHVVGATGDRSEKASQAHFGLPDEAMIDMGDFAGGLLKYVRDHPVSRVTIAGGFGKITKLAQGALDLHSARSSVDISFLTEQLKLSGYDREIIEAAAHSESANAVLALVPGHEDKLASRIAELAQQTARRVVASTPVKTDILIINRQGRIIGTSGA